jgi:hypothetical protein
MTKKPRNGPLILQPGDLLSPVDCQTWFLNEIITFPSGDKSNIRGLYYPIENVLTYTDLVHKTTVYFKENQFITKTSTSIGGTMLAVA